MENILSTEGPHNPTTRDFISENSGKMLWSNSPESIVSSTKPVLAMAVIPAAGRFMVAGHHANKTESNLRLRVVIARDPATEGDAEVTVLKNAQGHKYIEFGSGEGAQGPAVAGRDAVTDWFENVNIPEPDPNPFTLKPGDLNSIYVGDIDQGQRVVLGSGPNVGVAAWMMEFETDDQVTAFVVAHDTLNSWSDLTNPSNWAPRVPPQVRGTLQSYRILNIYASSGAAVLPMKDPNDEAYRRRYRLLGDLPIQPPADWKDLVDEIDDITLEFNGEYHVEQTIRFYAQNDLGIGGNVGLVVNGRGGVMGAAVWADHFGTVSVAPLCARPAQPGPLNLGLLVNKEDGVRVPQFSVLPGGPHPVELKYILGGGANAPVDFVAFPCTPFAAPVEER
ncbi:MAG: hypothetical protein IH851_09505 [Armatimonadetes bacterium]|nr:hypothetical protein [Armatimonadota bacterium]